MRQETITLYSFNELSDSAKQKALQDYSRRDREFFSWDEMKESLDQFCIITGIKLTNYSIGLTERSFIHFDFIYDIEEYPAERFIKNDLYRFLYGPKRFYNKGYTKHHDCKAIIEETSCPLTGVCYDEDLLEPIRKYIKNPRSLKNITVRSLIKDCLDFFITSCIAEMEYHDSEEGMIEEITNNDYEFYENGKIY